MGFDSKGLDDYIDVAQRIAEFRVKHPEGSLQPLNTEQPFEIRELAGTDKNGKEVRGTFIIYTAAAYRSADDPRPGIGCAYEVFPGRTPYTAGSELQNAETAAWGRAIVAALAADTRAGIASQQEVRNRQAECENPAPAPRRQNGNGQQRGQASRPPGETAPYPSTQDAVDVGAVDEDAQVFAEEAGRATTPQQIEGIHRRAREAKLLTKPIRNPSSGGVGKLAVYLDWRRKQVGAAGTFEQAMAQLGDSPWADSIRDLTDTEQARRLLAEAESVDMDAAKRLLVRNAILARFPDAGQAGNPTPAAGRAA